MIKYVAILLVVIGLTGCFETIPQKVEVVTVDKPIPYTPKPPDVPKFNSQVDKLEDSDATDPGKVVQAYKYDMTALRQITKIQDMIIEQYRASSQNFDAVNKEIDKLFESINKQIQGTHPNNR